MHEKYGKDGLVIYTVALDDPKDAAIRQRGAKILSELKPPFPVVMLDMPAEEWSKRLRMDSYPGVFVFNRENQYVQKQPVVKANGEAEEVDYKKLDEAVESLLKKK